MKDSSLFSPSPPLLSLSLRLLPFSPFQLRDRSLLIVPFERVGFGGDADCYRRRRLALVLRHVLRRPLPRHRRDLLRSNGIQDWLLQVPVMVEPKT